jgi:hypothetical protein
MRESISRIIFAAEVVLVGVPTAFIFVLPLVLPAAFILTPIALFGLAHTLIDGGPISDLWYGAGVLVKGLLSICSIVALLCLLALGMTFLSLGRAQLQARTLLLRWGMLFACPPILLSSIPGLVSEITSYPFSSDRLLAALLYSGLPLLLPACHLALEFRKWAKR